MKAVICTVRGGVHIHTPGIGKWEVCQCGNTGARWEDPEAGKLVVACRAGRDKVFGFGLNNQLLLPAITSKGQAGCWAVVFRIGSTGDTRWAEEAEYMECFPS